MTKPQVLPFGELSWENFERLCYRLAGKAERVEHVARYGRSGQAQQGIDLFVRLSGNKYEVWQAKRYDSIKAADVKSIVKAFRDGTWKDKSGRFVLAVQASLADKKVQDEIESQAAILNAEGITFLSRGGEELSDLLRAHPDVVDDFFGRDWVAAFVSPEAAAALGRRLDGVEFARVRSQLRGFLGNHFHLLDVGVALPVASTRVAPPSLLGRFSSPDVLIRGIASVERPPVGDYTPSTFDPSEEPLLQDRNMRPTTTRRRDYIRRVPLAGWLGDGIQLAVVGEAGSGKSTLLRCVALDLLSEQRVFPEIARRWGARLPIHISFSSWSRLSVTLGRVASLKEVVTEILQPALTADLISLLDRAIDEKRVVLLLDGLDEWSEEQAARTTLQYILAFVATHGLPTIVTARPRGLGKIGTIPPSWRVAELAPLSIDQQRRLAEVWFVRDLGQSASEHCPENRGPIEARLDRFFAELTRDQRLSSLAGNPLLLVGLVALSIRQVALPRNKMQAIQSLVSILLETHPRHRATAAGDTKERFVHIQSADDRRAALAHLAFVARSATGGGAYDINEAKKAIRKYLIDPATFAYSTDRAQAAASELLAVNAETVGLLTERAPGEIGFAHAVFAEYLAAEDLLRWPLADVLEFVRLQSANPLWRNVISNLVSLLSRPTEVEAVVAAIERARSASTSSEDAANRDVLLADIAFNFSRKQPATVERLVRRAFNVIENDGWMLARREILKAALTNIGEAGAQTPVDLRLVSWAPSCKAYLSNFFDALGRWKPSPDLRDTLLSGIHSDGRGNQRSAGIALGQLYGGDATVQRQLKDALSGTLDLSVASAALEALSIGWPETADLSSLHDAARASRDPTLRFVGIWGRLKSRRVSQEDKDALVALLSELSPLDYWDLSPARELLAESWPNDPSLIGLALEAVSRGTVRRGPIGRESAMHYLVRCSPDNFEVSNWIREELREKYPFSSLNYGLWECLVPFAGQHSNIRAELIEYFCTESAQIVLHRAQSLIATLGGDQLRDYLIKITRSDKSWTDMPAVQALLEGWGRADPIVAAFLDEIASWEGRKLIGLAPILPRIVTEPGACRARLLELGRTTEPPRVSFVARGFALLGTLAIDTEVVDTLLAGVGKGAPAYDPGDATLEHFYASPKVRRYALERLDAPDPPLAILASVYENDLEIRNRILRVANPLPSALRGDILEAASVEGSARPSFRRVLEGYDIEVEADLKIAASIYHHRQMAKSSGGANAEHLTHLVETLHAVGPDLHERRAAAFAGMVLLGKVKDIVPMMDYGDKPLTIQTGSGAGRVSDSLMALICERWEELSQAFGPELPLRFGEYQGGDDDGMWDCLAPHIGASSAARRAFLAYCGSTDSMLSLRSLTALAREQPSSDLLLDHCWRIVDEKTTGERERVSSWSVTRLRLEVAYILRDHFRDKGGVKQRLREALKRGESSDVVALAMFAPDDVLLENLRHTPKEIADQFSDWVLAVHLAAIRSKTQEFVELVVAMINRHTHGIWDFQDIVNRAVVERLQRDEEARLHLKRTLAADATVSETASLPRYLSAAGALDGDVLERCRDLLQGERRHGLPRAGYDAVGGTTCAVCLSLLEVFAPSFSP